MAVRAARGGASAAAENHDDGDDDNDDDDSTQTYVHDLLFPSGTGTHRCHREPSAPVRAFQPARTTLFQHEANPEPAAANDLQRFESRLDELIAEGWLLAEDADDLRREARELEIP
ncbi:hypothetical protein ACFWCA_02540 [Streptomyces phaeochromogenes]|uniref:hypothetical protein n=1 Tax=Streptomyces phaeochromogenes TaxID=1923 RepID=UPI0036885170